MNLTPAVTLITLFSWMSTSQVTNRAAVPNVTCRGQEEVRVGTRDLRVTRQPSTELYRFAARRLYISSDAREEYFYNDVSEVESSRYVSGNKTIFFDDPQHRSGTSVHTDDLETRVLRMRCVVN